MSGRFVVPDPQDQYRLAFRQNLEWVAAPFDGGLRAEITHLPVAASLYPGLIGRKRGWGGWRGYADEIKAEAMRFRLDELGK